MARAGQTVRAIQAIINAPACKHCHHENGHYERQYGAEGYRPLVFHCSAVGCSCTIDKSGTRS